jgi:hypothetical protein
MTRIQQTVGFHPIFHQCRFSYECPILTCMLLGFVRNRTSTIVVMYSLYLYFLGLSLRNTSKALDIFDEEKRSHIAIWNWIQRFGSCHIYNKRKRVSAFIIEMKLSSKLEIIIIGYGFVLNQFINHQCLALIYFRRKKHVCRRAGISLGP